MGWRTVFRRSADTPNDRAFVRQGMAERSGFPELDRAIAEFMQAHPEVEELRDPQNAWGRCEAVAEELAAFLKQRGFKAYAPADQLGAFPGYENAQDSAAIGAGDFSYPEHAMVEVYGLYGPNNVNTVTIDFTASQYGFPEFPKVHGGPADQEEGHYANWDNDDPLVGSGEGMDRFIEWVPTEHLAPMLEHNRDTDGLPGRTDAVLDSLNRVGFKEPVWVDFNDHTNMAHVSEGNHRLTVAVRSGIPAVPVAVLRSSRVPRNQSILRPHQYVGGEVDHTGAPYVPEYMKPSEIGMPTTEPWTPSRQSSADDVMYHVAPASARESIQQHGLDRDLGSPPWAHIPDPNHVKGNYVFARPEEAHTYADLANHTYKESFDVWAVSHDGIELQPDPQPNAMQELGESYYTTAPIPAERLRLHRQASTPPVPPAPGELPIPEGTLRWFHYTHPDNLDSIRQQGLLYSKGRGDSGTGADEPSKGVWASNRAPDEGKLDLKPWVEFYLHPEQISRNAEHYWHQDPFEWYDPRRMQHIIVQGDVPPEQIVAIHEPWQMHARYMAESGDLDQFAWVKDQPDDPAMREYAKAFDWLKAHGHGKQASAPPRSWHLTDKHDFALDPEYHPANNTTLGGDWPHKGLFVGDPSTWFDGYDYVRPFVAEIEHPPLEQFGGYGGENFLPAEAFPQSVVHRVIPFYQWQKEKYGDGHEGLEAPEGDVRQWTPEQVAAYKEQLNQYIKFDRPHMLRQVCPRCADDYVSPGTPCPKCGHATDWDGNYYSRSTPDNEHYDKRTASYYTDKLGPEAEMDWHANEEGLIPNTLPRHVFRSMSEDHFQQSMRDGVHESDERGNWVGQKAAEPDAWGDEEAPPEGTVAGRWAYPGYISNSANGLGRVVKIEVRPEDGWERHHEGDEEGGYWRTFKPIPTDRFVAWTDPINSRNGFRPVQSNILDPVRDTLDPAVFDDAGSPHPRLKPALREWLLDTIYNILEQGGYEGPERWSRLYLTGSLTTYQYAEHSDCDVSIYVNHHVFPEWSRAEMIGLMVEHCDGLNLPGTPHQLQVFVVAKGVEPEDLYQPGLRSGYDLLKDEWFVPPERERAHDVAHEDPEGYVNGLMAADKMERLLRYEPDKAVMYYKQLHRKRMADQKASKGDYAQSNLIYKMLDNRGLFDQLRELGVKIASEPQPQTPEWEEGNIPKYLDGLQRADRTFPGFVTIHDPEFYAQHRVFTSPDGHQGFALLDHGDGRNEIGGVFNTDPANRGAGSHGVHHAFRLGGNYFECFDQDRAEFSLPHHYYNLVGALPTRYHAWEDQYAHPQWDYDRFGTPGLVEMTVPEENQRDREATIAQSGKRPAEPFDHALDQVRGRRSTVHADGRTGQEHTDAWDDFEQRANQERVEREGR